MRLIGHRGARGEAPENTLSGFRHLRRLGLRAVEFDIQVSADDELVVIHAPRLERTTRGVGTVREHRADQLSVLDACRTSLKPSADGGDGAGGQWGGTISAASTPMITSTTISSISVKPRGRRRGIGSFMQQGGAAPCADRMGQVEPS